MSIPIPILVMGDAPGALTGLARIARDITAHLWRESELLDIKVGQFGQGYPSPVPWPSYLMGDRDWGAPDLETAWDHHSSGDPGVLLTVWDPSRCFASLRVPIRAARWGYFAVDAENPRGGLGGPAHETVANYQRVLAYGRYGSQVLKHARAEPVPYLPHGIDLHRFRPTTNHSLYQRLGIMDRHLLVGAVAANQPRKDMNILFEAIARWAQERSNIRLWLHTDVDVRHWSVPQLIHDYGLDGRVFITHELSDDDLAAMYSRCAVTIAPGLGEGFGYPIVESLACGTPVVHGAYGGGLELIPRPEWKFPVRARRVESIYNLVRPVFLAQDIVNAAERAITWEDPIRAQYCRGSVAHLDWRVLWPRWRSWIRKGLKAL